MEEGVCIRIWTRHTVPQQFAAFARFADDVECENTIFVAHVPAAMLADRTYKMCGEAGADVWLRDGELGLFGVNAIDTLPHPDGDGLLIVGSYM